MCSLGFSDGGFEFVAVSCVGFDGYWIRVVDSAFVELVLFSDLSFDLRAAPLFCSWLWFSFVGFDDMLGGLLDVEEVL